MQPDTVSCLFHRPLIRFFILFFLLKCIGRTPAVIPQKRLHMQRPRSSHTLKMVENEMNSLAYHHAWHANALNNLIATRMHMICMPIQTQILLDRSVTDMQIGENARFGRQGRGIPVLATGSSVSESEEAMMGGREGDPWMDGWIDSGTWMGIPAHLLKTASLKTVDPHHLPPAPAHSIASWLGLSSCSKSLVPCDAPIPISTSTKLQV